MSRPYKSESPIETRLRDKLTSLGFKVLKLTCPGTSHVPDRMILRPKWSPGPPWYIEMKATGKTERRAQELTREDWLERGVLVLDPVDSYDEVDDLVSRLFSICQAERIDV